jgi:hypothetical protein
MIQTLVSVGDPSYTLPAWQTWLLTLGVAILCCASNLFFEKWFARLQYVAMFLHVAGLLATVAVLWSLGPRISAKEALLDFSNLGGWSSTGLAVMVGQLTVVFALGGSDAAAHLSEECKHSGLTVPRTIFWTIMINGTMGFLACVSFIFAIPSVEDAISDPSGFSMVYVFRLCGGNAAVIGLVLIQLILITFGNISFQAAAARQTYAVSIVDQCLRLSTLNPNLVRSRRRLPFLEMARQSKSSPRSSCQCSRFLRHLHHHPVSYRSRQQRCVQRYSIFGSSRSDGDIHAIYRLCTIPTTNSTSPPSQSCVESGQMGCAD